MAEVWHPTTRNHLSANNRALWVGWSGGLNSVNTALVSYLVGAGFPSTLLSDSGPVPDSGQGGCNRLEASFPLPEPQFPPGGGTWYSWCLVRRVVLIWFIWVCVQFLISFFNLFFLIFRPHAGNKPRFENIYPNLDWPFHLLPLLSLFLWWCKKHERHKRHGDSGSG